MPVYIFQNLLNCHCNNKSLDITNPLYYIILFLSIVAISLCASLISCRHDLWKINFKQTFFGMLFFFTLVLILYILFGAARPLTRS
jgi:predicted membrane protein